MWPALGIRRLLYCLPACEPSGTVPLPVAFHPNLIVRSKAVVLPGTELPSSRNPNILADRRPIIDRLIDHWGSIDSPGSDESVDYQERNRPGQEAAGEVTMPMPVMMEMVHTMASVAPVVPTSRLGELRRSSQQETPDEESKRYPSHYPFPPFRT